jgi:hypothetical protein
VQLFSDREFPVEQLPGRIEQNAVAPPFEQNCFVMLSMDLICLLIAD